MRVVSIWLLSFLTSVCGVASFSADKTCDVAASKAAAIDTCINVNKLAQGTPAFIQCYQRNFDSGCGNATGSALAPEEQECKDARKSYTDSMIKFNQSCVGGEAECLYKAYNCANCKGKNPPSYCPGYEAETRFNKKQLEAKKNNQALPTSGVTITAAGSCPDVASKYVDELKTEIKENKETARSKKDDLSQAIEDLDTAKAELKTKEEDTKSHIDEIESERDKKIKAEKIEQKQIQKEKTARFDKLSDVISQSFLDTQKLKMSVIEAISAAERECHNRALDQLNIHLKDRRASLSANQLSAPSLKGLFSSSGKGRDDKNAEYANKYYESCLRDRNHTDKIKSIKRNETAGLEQINDSIGSARAEQAKLIKEISGAEVQSEFKEKMESIFKDAQRDINNSNKAYTSFAATQNAKITALNRKIELLKSDVQINDAELIHMQAVYSAASAISSGKDDSGAKFFENFQAAQSSSGTFLSSCKNECSNKDDKGNLIPATQQTPDCRKARAYYCALQMTDALGEECEGFAQVEGKGPLQRGTK